MVTRIRMQSSGYQDIAEGRNIKESSFGAMTYGDRLSGVNAHSIGASAEMAVAIYLGTEVDREITPRGDDGIDLQVDGLSVGVKASTYMSNPFLRVEVEHFSEHVDRYVLCAVDINDHSTVEIIGWASSSDVVTAPTRKFLDRGPLNYVLSESELRDMSTW